MDAALFCQILQQTLVPFIQEMFPPPAVHKLMQDNNHKHASRYAQNLYEQAGINWWRMPPESPDLNPIENVWHELKEHLQREVKPRTKQELIDGISQFWRTVNVHKYWRYINHLRKVIPKVIETNGNATGY